VLKFPRLAYATGRNGEMLNMTNMAKWCLFAFLQGLLLFVLAVRFIGGPSTITSKSGAFKFDIYGTGLNTVGDGWGMGIYPEGFLLYTVAVVAMQYKIVAMAVTPNSIFWFLWILSFLGYILFVYLYGLFPTLDFYNAVPLALGQPVFWLAVTLIPLTLALSDYCFDGLWSYLSPSSRDELLKKLADEERMRSREKDRSSCTNGVVMRTISITRTQSPDQEE
jgi:magnesium-transporting ATPase (P-type)